MSKFTKGPWVQDKWGRILDQSGRDVLFRGLTLLGSGSEERTQEADANTRIAGAAPELLEALEHAERTIFRLQADQAVSHRIDRYLMDARRQAKAAIAKARGES